MKNFICSCILVLLISGFNYNAIAQVVLTDPALPIADQPVTITFQAGGTGLEGYSGDVYAHTGVTVDGSQWQHVIGSWGNNSTQPQLTNIGVDTYELQITPSISDYYGVSDDGVISEICLVFRSADGSQQTSPDIFIDVYQEGLNVSIVAPDTKPFFVDQNELFEIVAQSTGAQSLSLYIDNVLITSVDDNQISYTLSEEYPQNSKHFIKVVAVSDDEEAIDETYFYVRGVTYVMDLPDGVRDGINYINDTTVTLVLHAPYKNSVFVIGDFNFWNFGPYNKLKRNKQDASDPEVRYWITLTGLIPGKEYGFQYFIDESLVVADAYADKILDPYNDKYIDFTTYPNLKSYPDGKTDKIVSVFQTAQPEYPWQVSNFDAPDETDLVIYELLIRDFLDDHNFKSLKETIPYFLDLGVNAIELMPVNEFEGNLSWGYNPSFYFAPDKYYGTKHDFKDFIDECHANGIAVIMDMVLNHAYGQNVFARMYWDNLNNRPAANNPWFNPVCPHPPYCWGNDFDHESVYTQNFIDRVTEYWLTEYKIDGFRFDYTQGFTNSGSGGNYDATRIQLIKRMSDEIWTINPKAYVILEHWTANSEEKVLADYGCMLWGNMNYNYNEATMGWNDNSNLSGVSYKSRNFNDPHLVAFMESHDEERLMAKNINYGNSSGGYDIQDTTTALERMELAGVFYFTVPGPKMIWQFGELGYDYHINYPGAIGGEDHRLDQKPIRWDYLNQIKRNKVYHVWGLLNDLKTNYDVFRTTDFDLSVSGAMKKIHLNHSTMNVTILGNFGVTPDIIVPNFQHTGYWYDYFSGDSVFVTNVNDVINLEAGEYKLFTDENLKPAPKIMFVKPLISNSSVQLNEEIDIEVNTFWSDTVKLYIDDELIQTVSSSNLSYSFTANTWGKHWIKVKAINDIETTTDSIFYDVATQVRFVYPEKPIDDFGVGRLILVEINAINFDSVFYYVDGELISSGTQSVVKDTVTAKYGTHFLIAKATYGSSSVYDTTYYVADSLVSNINKVNSANSFIAFPNPSNDKFTFRFFLENKSSVNLMIFNYSGQLIKNFNTSNLSLGENKVLWSARDDHGRKVRKGIYFCILEVNGKREVRKLIYF
ncbi:MAG: T9SS type A sorting domain-containing protein [Bacteroidales bacterium]|nr:T9SS type A sorting domain-containing protein [Bacteroidales bacterium]